MRNGILKLRFFGLFFFGIAGLLSAEVRYAVTDLGTLGGDYSIALDINNLGQIVGQSKLADGSDRAFLWDNGIMYNLGTLGGNSSAAMSINDAGQIVGSSKIANDTEHAFLFKNGEMLDLGRSQSEWSGASGINNAGQIIGYSRTGINPYATLWEGQSSTDIMSLSSGSGINQSGQVIGTVSL